MSTPAARTLELFWSLRGQLILDGFSPTLLVWGPWYEEQFNAV